MLVTKTRDLISVILNATAQSQGEVTWKQAASCLNAQHNNPVLQWDVQKTAGWSPSFDHEIQISDGGKIQFCFKQFLVVYGLGDGQGGKK